MSAASVPPKGLWASSPPPRQGRRGFTLPELQVAIVLLAFEVVVLASLLATRTPVLKRAERGAATGSAVSVTPASDPWVRKLRTAARQSAIAPDPLLSPPPR
jgi:prepilin-type N-terminal cleavage/methylation domain-containing protein